MTRILPEIVSGKVTRKTFSKIKEAIELPYLVKIQKDSYDAFIREGIGEVLEDFSPITDYSDHFEMYFLDYSLDGKPKYDEKECRDRDATYALPLRVKVRLVNKVTDEVIDQEVFMGDFPLMTDNGSFIINGAERVIVSQLVRSPGVYNGSEMDKSGKKLFNTTVIPSRGAWLEFEQDSQNVLWVRVDRTRKLTATVLLRALGFGSDDELKNNLFTGNKMIADTVDKDTSKSESDSLIELYRRLRPGEIPTEEAVKQHLKNLFFDPRRYDLARVGRYKFNKRLRLGARIVGLKSAETVVSPDGEVLAEEGAIITKEQAEAIQNAGINVFYADVNGEKHKIIANNVVSFKEVTGVDPRLFGLLDYVYFPALEFSKVVCETARENGVEETAEILRKEINAFFYIDEKKSKAGEEKPEDKKNEEKARETRIKFINACVKYYDIIENELPETLSAEVKKVIRPLMDKLNHKHITVDDIVASVSVNLDLAYGINTVDNIDHLGNRRVRSVGELLQNQFRIGIARLERVIRERMGTVQDTKDVSPQGLINVRPVSSAIKEFFGSSQLSQFMDQTNPIAELTHKRKLSALGPGGLNRDRATFEVRDVHHSHYGRMCPIETPEGQNIGLISSLAAYAKVNEFGFIESPYRKIEHVMNDEGKIETIVTEHVDYLTADEEDNYIVAQANEPLIDNKYFVNERVSCRHRDEITEDVKEKMDYMDVSPKQLISVATALIPFLENDDTNRALMGSNMQRQAVPLLCPENAIVATGIERRIAYDSGVMVNAVNAGVVKSVASDRIVITEDDGNERQYILKKFERSNQGTCLNQRPIVDKGERIEKGQTIADGPSTKNGELALGRNILVGFMSWEGYNYEDAILLSEKLVREDVFTNVRNISSNFFFAKTSISRLSFVFFNMDSRKYVFTNKFF